MTDPKDYLKSMGETHGASVGKKIQEFKQKHPETDVGPQALIALSTEQTQELTSGASWLCGFVRPLITMASGLYCSAIFGWSLNMFDVFACYVSFMIPFEAVCMR